jgi:hypothetical protein
MNTEKLNHEKIQINCPKSWEDFKKFYKEEFENNSLIKNLDFTQLPFKLDICNTEYALLPQTITDAFNDYEKVISHYS